MAPPLLRDTYVETQSTETQIVKANPSNVRERLIGSLLTSVSFVAGFGVTIGIAMYLGFVPSLSLKSLIPPASPEIASEEKPVDAPVVDNGSSDVLTHPTEEQVPAPLKASGAAATPEAAPTPAPVLESAKAETATKAALPEFDREAVLNDSDHRIAEDFSIPANLRDRAGFWFDIYTKYDSEKRVIHHARFPWIIYKVVDVTPIIFADKPNRRWMRNEKADKLVKDEQGKIKAAIRSLARNPKKTELNEYEILVKEALSKLGGDLKKEANHAVGEVRIQMGQRNFFSEGLEVSPRYITTMEHIFESNNLPVDLTRIPFVESSFNKQATSKVGASGIWQFMNNTGRKFMIVDSSIDERRSPFKATEGAARLLKENHLILHREWPLAITAWNHGPGGMRKAMKAAGSRDLGTIIARYHSRSFDFASSNFYCEFLGALHAERYNREIFGELEREEKLDLLAFKLPRRTKLNDILRVANLSNDQFFTMNPEIRSTSKNMSLPKGFRVHVTDKARVGIERLFSIASANSPRSNNSPNPM
jgi:membrane-bound lytic murein transglycosylase D